MIPISLQITNFLSYQETAELDFNGIRTACISGRNGAGKSSILDAMTWVLFGKSRGKSDDDVINRKAARDKGTAEVQLEFALEGNTYRVIRRKRLRRATVLELQMAGEEGWKPLTESKVRETQVAIENLLRMNYDTFINASFLLQGKADEFTTKTPNQRKTILADLLGVSQWEIYRERAVTERRRVEQERLLKGDRIEGIKEDLADRPDREAAHAAAQERLEGSAARMETQEKLLNQARKTDAIRQQQNRQLETLRRSLAEVETRLADLASQQSNREAEKERHSQLLAERAAIERAYADWQAATAAATTWQEKANQYHQLQSRRAPLLARIDAAKSRLEDRRQTLQTRAETAASLPERIHAAEDQVAALNQELATAQARRTAIAEQEQAWLEAQNELQRLQNERANLSRRRDELARQAQTSTARAAERDKLTAQIEKLQLTLQEQQTKLQQAESGRRELNDLRHELERREQEQPALKEQMDKMKERMDRLQSETGSDCPLCGQPLTEAHRQEVLAQIKVDGKQMGDAYRANRNRITELGQLISQSEAASKELVSLEESVRQNQARQTEVSLQQRTAAEAVQQWQNEGAPALAELEIQLADESALQAQQARVAELADIGRQRADFDRQISRLQSRLAQSESGLAALQKDLSTWQETEAPELAAISAQLAADDFAQSERTSLVEVDAEIAALAYDGQQHQQANEARDKLAAAPERQRALQQAETAMQHVEEMLASLAQRYGEQKAQQTAWQAEADQLTQSLALLDADGAVDLAKLEDELFALREEHQKAREALAVAESRLVNLQQQAEKHQVLLDEIALLDRRIQQLRLLENACGRNGVQALLIEQALPDLENRANMLLERLSDGEMTISFETQRQLKSRDELAETLDIRINDTAGERPYENYSGGEQFRVNFAVRLALSQLLAQRSGARLQTLVVDEGFGSQDPAGRQRLVEAINIIQPDFERILVITHIDELKDAFPTRIEVVKDIHGSRIEVA
ncbi:MAG: SMC family ATPase [Ardenticatenales bacterium]|nr:SMC family ATPase [Ardenticatenales bacterium]